DNGQTWSAPALVAAGFNETSLLCLPSGDVLAACRETTRDRPRLWTCRSRDGGVTWSEPTLVTDDFQHPADLVMLDEATLLLLYGNRQQPYRVEGRISRDEGQTWTDQLLLVSGQLYGYAHATPRPTDMGYPSGVLTSDGNRVVITYYYNPFPRVQERAWSGPWTTPFYLSDGYRGVSISLDRAELLAALA
ncbi:MAG: sialidase family protein, partial [Thermomicrobiales bacterium]